jgi:ABC-type phosphate transport system substrate-binding protein
VGAWLALAPAAPAGAAPAVDLALPAYTPQPVQVPQGARYLAPDGSIRIVGAEQAQVLIERLDALFKQAHPGVRFTPVLRGSSTAMPALTHGVTLFGPSGREASPVEVVPYQKIVGTEPLAVRVAHSNPPGRHLYFFVRKPPGQPVDPVAKEYLRLVLSQQGQQIVAADPEGYLPLNASETATELEKLQ